jgi:hypothetical protein
MSVRHLEAHMARHVVYDGDANTMVNLIDTRGDLKLAAEGGRSTGSGHILRHRLFTHNKYVRACSVCAHSRRLNESVTPEHSPIEVALGSRVGNYYHLLVEDECGGY